MLWEGGRQRRELSLQSLSSHRLFHTVPNVPHYSSKCMHPSLSSWPLVSMYPPLTLSLPHPENKAIGVMKPGHSFTIEPMINEGAYGPVDMECSLIPPPPPSCPPSPLPPPSPFVTGTWRDVTWPDQWTAATVVGTKLLSACFPLTVSSLACPPSRMADAQLSLNKLS